MNYNKQWIGAAIIIAAELIWDTWPDHTMYSIALQASQFAFIEHYHIGLALLAFDQPVTDGAGATLVGIEASQMNPFGIGKTTVYGNLTLTALLFGILLIRRLK